MGHRRITRIVVRAALLGFLALAALLGLWVGSRVEAVTLQGRPPGWIVIEYLNPKCPKLPSSALGRKITVPADGYACFSDSPLLGPSLMHVRDAEGQRVEPERILQHGFTKAELGPCHLAADVFFYGTPEALAASSSDAGTVLRARHPECH